MDMYTLPNVTEPQDVSVFHSLSSVITTVIPLFATFVGLIGLLSWCVQDYRFFKSLGPGGPPYNVFGWFQISFMVRPFTLSTRDTLWTGDYPSYGAHKEILALPNRKGERPVILGIAPQRQFSQRPTAEMNTRVLNLFSSFVLNNSKLLQQRVSGVEKHHSALFVHPALLAKPATLPEATIISRGELGHIHDETSLHLYVSPADAKVVIEKGWAQRHRCARTQPWWLGGGKNMWNIGDTFLIVYAPRNDEEFDVLQTLIKASARFMTGGAAINV